MEDLLSLEPPPVPGASSSSSCGERRTAAGQPGSKPPPVIFAGLYERTERSRGIVKSYHLTEGYGFIDCPYVKHVLGSDSTDVFLHHSAIDDTCRDQVTRGAGVSFRLKANREGKPQ
ncbi:unnamed protein product, partial [Polarella glacialis]